MSLRRETHGCVVVKLAPLDFSISHAVPKDHLPLEDYEPETVFVEEIQTFERPLRKHQLLRRLQS